MASGNFCIGKGLNIALEAFNEYAQPYLKIQGYEVKDKIQIPHPDNIAYDTMLVSITGKGNLEKKLNTMLLKIDKDKKKGEALKKQGNPAYMDYIYAFSTHENKGQLKTIGVYDKDETASELFSSLAQEHLLGKLQRQVNEVEGELSSFLNRKVKSFAN